MVVTTGASGRAGRGIRLRRNQRKHAWTVLDEYRQQLSLQNVCEHADLIREARFALGCDESHDYVSVVADEVQDFRTSDLRFLRALVPEGPNDILVVGVPHQRIYVSLARRP